jgi:hypothetical protein
MIDPSRRLVPSTAPEDHPIHDAAEAGELARVRAFLDQQPSLVHDINRAGGHPLHRAVIGGSADVVTLLLDRGADIHAIHGFLDPYDLVWKGEDDEVMRIVTERPETALAGCGGVFTAVVTCGRRKLMRRLLDAGFTVHPQAGGCHSYLLERPDMLRELLTRGGLDPNYPTVDGVTLLHELCHRTVAGGRWTIGRSVRGFCWSSAPIRHRRTRTARRP